MEVIKLGDNIKVKECRCDKCESTFSYTKYDVKTYNANWERTGIESSRQYADEHIFCPVCNKKIILDSWFNMF